MATSANLEKTTKPLESQSPESLHNRNTDSIVGFLVQCTSTVKNAKNHLLVYKIAFVAFELRFKKCCNDCILFLVDGCHFKPVCYLVRKVMRDCLMLSCFD